MSRRSCLVTAGLAASVAAVLFLFRISSGQQPDRPESPPNRKTSEQGKPDHPTRDEQLTAKATQLPIGQVVLFSSGVGYFQREGTVEGTTRVDLSFPVQDINDLLKSMVLRDLDGGQISTVSYDSNAPVERTLKSFAINLTGNPGFGAILNQARTRRTSWLTSSAPASGET